jgi:hypothetical protein
MIQATTAATPGGDATLVQHSRAPLARTGSPLAPCQGGSAQRLSGQLDA